MGTLWANDWLSAWVLTCHHIDIWNVITGIACLIQLVLVLSDILLRSHIPSPTAPSTHTYTRTLAHALSHTRTHTLPSPSLTSDHPHTAHRLSTHWVSSQHLMDLMCTRVRSTGPIGSWPEIFRSKSIFWLVLGKSLRNIIGYHNDSFGFILKLPRTIMIANNIA